MLGKNDPQGRYIYVKNPVSGEWEPYVDFPVCKPFAEQSLTVSSTAVSLSVPHGTMFALLSAEGAEMRYWLTGTAPTTALGHLLQPMDEKIFNKFELEGFKAIRTGASDGTVRATYYRPIEQ